MRTNQADPMEPQEVLPVQYALPQNDAWGRTLRIIAVLCILFGATHAALGGLMMYVSNVNINMSFGQPTDLVVGIAIMKLAGGAAAMVGGIKLMLTRAKVSLTMGLIVLLGTELVQHGVNLWMYFHAGPAIGTSWLALSSLTTLYLLITSFFPVGMLVILWQSRKQA